MFTKPVRCVGGGCHKSAVYAISVSRTKTIEQEIGRTIHKQFTRGYVGPEVRGTKRLRARIGKNYLRRGFDATCV